MSSEGSSSYRFCGSKLIPWSAIDVTVVSRLILIVMCGSFNPIHCAHIAMYDAVYNTLKHKGKGDNANLVVGGFISPVNDHYGKEDLRPFSQRTAICAAALIDHPSLAIDEWEGLQSSYVRTYFVLDHLQTMVQRWYEETAGPNEAQLAWVRQHPVHIVFACGADLFATFFRPGCWPLGLLKKLLDRFDVAVVGRAETSGGCKTLLRDHGSLLQEYVKDTTSGQMTMLTLELTAYHFEEVDIFENHVSSSTIRELLARNHEADISGLVPTGAEALVRAFYTK